MKKLLLFVLMGLSISAFAQLQEEGFEGNWPPQGWGIYNVSGSGVTWNQMNNNIFPAFNSGKMAYLGKEDVAQGTTEDWLVTKQFTVQANSYLKFYSRLLLGGNQGNIFRVMISTDPDQTNLSSYIQLKEWNELQLNPHQTAYKEVSVLIPASYTGNQVYIAFVMQGDNGDSWFIDNVSTTNCAPPGNITIGNITQTTATLAWSNPSGATSWEVDIVPAGSPSFWQGMVVNSLPFQVAGFDGGSYDVYVRALCPQSPSIWVGPVNFNSGSAVGSAISCTVKYDADNNSVCNALDVPLPLLPIEVTLNNNTSFFIYTNQQGYYNLYTTFAGQGIITLEPTLPSFMPAIAPVTQSIDFANGPGQYVVDICVPHSTTPVNEASVDIIPTGVARPGFPATYSLHITNNGNGIINNAVVTLTFNDGKLEFASATSPNTLAGNTLSFPINNLLPFSSQVIGLIFNVFPPPENIGGEVLAFNTTLSGVPNDANTQNNVAVLNQVVVNSYDPNDITVHEGAFITEAQADGELTYTIRFQNTGTAEAINVKLVNMLDSHLDPASFRPLASSHNYSVSRTQAALTFKFDNIMLPHSAADEPGSHGYITYKVKPKSTFAIGDVISNTADIYFDFNPPIITNTVTTQIQAMARDTFSAGTVSIYPNPVSDVLTIAVKDGELLSAEVFDINGRKCNVQVLGNTLNVQQLQSGMYLLKVSTTQGNSVFKLVKQ